MLVARRYPHYWISSMLCNSDKWPASGMGKTNYQWVQILFVPSEKYAHKILFMVAHFGQQIEIDVGPNHQYHSVFACPILRQQSSEQNPPMRLVCGHVISRDALNKLGNNVNKYVAYRSLVSVQSPPQLSDRRFFRLKCPYCPVEQNTSEAIELRFWKIINKK